MSESVFWILIFSHCFTIKCRTCIVLLKKNNTSELIIWIDNSDKNSKTEFHLKLLDLNEETLNIPEVDFDYQVSLPSNDFQKLCRDMQNLSEQIKLYVDNECIKISCEGDFASQDTVIGETTHGLIYTVITSNNHLEKSNHLITK